MIFFILFIVGILLRTFTIGQRDFWFDEAFSYHIARLPVQDLIAATLADNNPPLYYLLLHYVLKISHNEIVLRLPSLVFSLLTIPLIYTLFKTQINKRVATIAASLFSVSPLAIYTATEVRPHGPAVIIMMLITLTFFLLIKKPNAKYNISFIFLAILGLYTHFYTLLLFIPFTLIIIFGKTQIKLSKWLFILATILLTLAPWFFLSIQNTHSDCACPNTILSFPASLASPAIGGLGEVTIRVFPTLPLPVLLLFGISALTTLFFFLKGIAQNRLSTILYLLPFGTLSLLGLFLPVFSPKAFAVFSPFYFAIVAVGIASYRKSGLITLILMSLIGIISLIQFTNPFFAGERIKPIYEIVKQNQEYPVAHTSLLTYYSLNYYSQGNQKHILITKNPLSVATLRFIGGRKQEVDKNASGLWIVDTEKWTDTENRKNALKTISDAYYVERMHKIDKISVSLLKRK